MTGEDCPRPGLGRGLATVALVVMLAACETGAATDQPAISAVTTTVPAADATTPAPVGTSGGPDGGAAPETVEYLDDVEADVHVPHTEGWAVAILVPGGSWETAERDGLTPLAEELASHGVFVVNAAYRARADGGGYPSMVEDVVCAARFAGRRATDAGLDADPIVVIGHSAGAHLAAMAALVGDALDPPCPHPPTPIDALVGLAGPYDITLLPHVADNLFGTGPEDDTEVWEEGNPITHAAARPDVPVLLLHGEADDTVDVSFTDDFAAALRAGGHEVDVRIVPGATHASIYTAEVAADPIVEWMAQLG